MSSMTVCQRARSYRALPIRAASWQAEHFPVTSCFPFPSGSFKEAVAAASPPPEPGGLPGQALGNCGARLSVKRYIDRCRMACGYIFLCRDGALVVSSDSLDDILSWRDTGRVASLCLADHHKGQSP